MKIKGEIVKIHRAGENWSAIIVKTEDGKKISASGNICSPIEKVTIEMEGKMEIHPTYGEQFKVTQSKYTFSKEEIASINFLKKSISGIGTRVATDIVATFGADIPKVMEEPKQLLTIKGIGKKTLDKIISSYEQNKNAFVLFQITSGLLTAHQAAKIAEAYGEDAANILMEDPYKIIYDIHGIAFSTADAIANKTGIKMNDTKRIVACLVYCLQTAADTAGHCYLAESELKKAMNDFLFDFKSGRRVLYEEVRKIPIPNNTEEWDESPFGKATKLKGREYKAFVDAVNSDILESTTYLRDDYNFDDEDYDVLNALLAMKNNFKENFHDIVRECLDKEMIIIEDGRIYNKKIHKKEEQCAQMIKAALNRKPLLTLTDKQIDDLIRKEEDSYGPDFEFGDEQKDAIKCSIKNSVSLIIGGPGRGKTRIIKVICTACKSKKDIVLLAPTGRAARRMFESTGIEARTIHRAIKDGTFGKKVIIVDEMSMTDIELLQKLLVCCNEAQIIFVGDMFQLPSVGPGCVLKDLVESGKIPFVKLEKLYRNSGSIAENSELIKKGAVVDTLLADTKCRFYYMSKNKANETDFYKEVVEKTVGLYKDLIKQKVSPKDICILTPRRKDGPHCVNALNRLIQNEINPRKNGDPFIEGLPFRVGDRVMQLKNNYFLEGEKDGFPILGAFNGEVGTITQIDPSEETITVLFDDDKTITYDNRNYDELELAYATTVHKSQGSEYRHVILVSTQGYDYMLLNRNLLYTAVSRASEKFYFIGEKYALDRAIKNDEPINRQTTLAMRIA